MALLLSFLLGITILLAAEEDEFVVYLPFVQVPGEATSGTVVDGLPFDPYSRQSGEGTYYAATGEGNCSFDASPGNLMVAAMNDRDYGDSWICGAFVEVNGPEDSVFVRIVDRCPECPEGDVDLSREAFDQIARIEDGRVDIDWRILSPDLQTPIIYHFKDGSNQWWTAVQIRNHRNPVAKLEFLDDDGNFQEVPRKQYNYFVFEAGMGPGPYTFRVTDIYGHTLTDTNIPFLEDGEVQGASQFPGQP
jgi:expansin (peptidoglycan-binding protein)